MQFFRKYYENSTVLTAIHKFQGTQILSQNYEVHTFVRKLNRISRFRKFWNSQIHSKEFIQKFRSKISKFANLFLKCKVHKFVPKLRKLQMCSQIAKFRNANCDVHKNDQKLRSSRICSKTATITNSFANSGDSTNSSQHQNLQD